MLDYDNGLGASSRALAVRPEVLGSPDFRRDHGVRYAYVAGSMYKAVASEDMVIRMSRAGLLSYFGTGGVGLDRVAAALERFRSCIGPGGSYGLNLLASLDRSSGKEQRLVELLLRHDVRRVEAAAYMQVTAGLVRYRVSGMHRRPDGSIVAVHKVLAKVSRPEVCLAFLSPPPEHLLQQLVETGEVSAEEAELARRMPMADDICAEADSGGHTDQRPFVTLLPDMVRLRDRVIRERRYPTTVRVGVAGGIGTPESVAAAFVMGADFVLTGSINQCTVEAGTSDEVKDLLQQASVQDTTIVPAGDMLEIGAKAQVLKKGLFFPARANKLYELYRQYDSLESIDQRIASQIQERYFRRTFEEVWAETRNYYKQSNPLEIEKAERDPKHKMALVFRWYFVHSARLAMAGSSEQRVDYQVACGPAMGALNNYLRGTRLESWRHRHVDELAELLMTGAARLLSNRLAELSGATPSGATGRAS